MLHLAASKLTANDRRLGHLGDAKRIHFEMCQTNSRKASLRLDLQRGKNHALRIIDIARWMLSKKHNHNGFTIEMHQQEVLGTLVGH